MPESVLLAPVRQYPHSKVTIEALQKMQDHLDLYIATYMPTPSSPSLPPSSPSSPMATPPSSPVSAMATSSLLHIPPMDLDIDPPASVSSVAYTLGEFNERAIEFHNTNEFTEFSQFVLSGIEDNKKVSIVHRGIKEDPFVYIYRFYGRIVGISDSIHARETLKLNNLCSWANSLRDESQITWTWESEGETHIEPLSNIPNILLGTFGTKSSIYILLPSLFDSDSPTCRVEVAHLRELWDSAIIPALVTSNLDPFGYKG